MKKKNITVAAFFLAAVLVSASDVFREGHGMDGSRKSAGPPACYAGEPPNNATCRTSGCHSSFALNSGTALLSLDLGGAEAGYTPGADYTISVSVSKPGIMRGGFQLIALQNNDVTTSPGIFTLTNTVRTQRIDINNPHAHPNCAIHNKVWIEHAEGGIDDVSDNAISWQFDWQAPANDVGGITFYVAAVEADVDFDATGDYVYSTSRTVEAVPISIGVQATEHGDAIRVFPNPVSDFLHLSFPETALANGQNTVVICDISGRPVLQSALTAVIPVHGLRQGRYHVIVTVDGLNRVFPVVRL